MTTEQIANELEGLASSLRDVEEPIDRDEVDNKLYELDSLADQVERLQYESVNDIASGADSLARDIESVVRDIRSAMNL